MSVPIVPQWANMYHLQQFFKWLCECKLMVNFYLISSHSFCSSLTSQKVLFNMFDNVDMNISNNSIESIVRYWFIFISFAISKSRYFTFQNHGNVCTLLAHYIIICFICKVSALNEEHYSNICEAVCNIY